MPAPAALKFPRGLPQTKQFGERLRILVLQGNDEGVCYCLSGSPIFIGRDNCQIVFSDENISKRHAEISWRTDHYSVRDLGSSNGVILNGEKINESPIKPGDILLFGVTVVQVCAPGQAKRGEFLLGGPVSDAAVNAATKNKKIEQVDTAKKLTEKRKLLLYGVLIFGLYLAYASSDSHQTNRDSKRVDFGDTAEKPTSTGLQISKEDKKKNAERIKTVFDEYVPKYNTDTPQRKEADKFFQLGRREQQNKNYRRAINAFETSLTIDPSHQLAKVYLASTKEHMYADIKQNLKAAKEARGALRYKQARIYYESILRLMEVSRDDDTYKNDDYYKTTIKELEELSALEKSESGEK